MADSIESIYTVKAEKSDTSYTFEVLNAGTQVRLTITTNGAAHVFMIDTRDMEDFSLAASNASHDVDYWND